MYKGFTENLHRRMFQHFYGKGCMTTKRNPPQYILHYEIFKFKYQAMARENFFKTKEGYNWLQDNISSLNTIHPTT